MQNPYKRIYLWVLLFGCSHLLVCCNTGVGQGTVPAVQTKADKQEPIGLNSPALVVTAGFLPLAGTAEITPDSLPGVERTSSTLVMPAQADQTAINQGDALLDRSRSLLVGMRKNSEEEKNKWRLAQGRGGDVAAPQNVSSRAPLVGQRGFFTSNRKKGDEALPRGEEDKDRIIVEEKELEAELVRSTKAEKDYVEEAKHLLSDHLKHCSEAEKSVLQPFLTRLKQAEELYEDAPSFQRLIQDLEQAQKLALFLMK